MYHFSADGYGIAGAACAVVTAVANCEHAEPVAEILSLCAADCTAFRALVTPLSAVPPGPAYQAVMRTPMVTAVLLACGEADARAVAVAVLAVAVLAAADGSLLPRAPIMPAITIRTTKLPEVIRMALRTLWRLLRPARLPAWPEPDRGSEGKSGEYDSVSCCQCCSGCQVPACWLGNGP